MLNILWIVGLVLILWSKKKDKFNKIYQNEINSEESYINNQIMQIKKDMAEEFTEVDKRLRRLEEKKYESISKNISNKSDETKNELNNDSEVKNKVNHSSIYDSVIQLLKDGVEVEDICAITNISKGEVLLLKDLHKKIAQ